MDRQIEFADLLSIVSLYLAIRNLSKCGVKPPPLGVGSVKLDIYKGM